MNKKEEIRKWAIRYFICYKLLEISGLLALIFVPYYTGKLLSYWNILTQLEPRSIFDLYTIGLLVDIGIVCTILPIIYFIMINWEKSVKRATREVNRK